MDGGVTPAGQVSLHFTSSSCIISWRKFSHTQKRKGGLNSLLSVTGSSIVRVYISYAKIKDFSTSNPRGIYISSGRKLLFTKLRGRRCCQSSCPGGRLSAWGQYSGTRGVVSPQASQDGTGKCASLHVCHAYEVRQQSAQCTPQLLHRYVPELLAHSLTHTHTSAHKHT